MSNGPVQSTINTLKLTNFRNYETLSLETSARAVVFSGANGSGKTNILEAISLFSPGRGLRRARYTDMVRRDAQSGFSVFCDFLFDDDDVPIGTGLKSQTDSSRTLKIRGEASKSADEVLQYCRILWLTPAMDGLFTGPAGDRRRFLDRLVLAIYPDHGRQSRALEQALRDRNRLLDNRNPDPSWLDGVEAQISSFAISIAAARNDLISQLSHLMKSNEINDVFPQAILEIKGELETRLQQGMIAGDVELWYQNTLRTSRLQDAAAGRTLTGPHRSELSVTHKEKAIPAALASTGEQKALLLGIMIAQTRLTSLLSGLTPILLLDEIAAHLDPARRKTLFEILHTTGAQTFMTGTDAFLFAEIGNEAIHYQISNATAERL